MYQWLEPRLVITIILIGIFGAAYLNDPNDAAMKGALIGAFSSAMGFWLGTRATETAAARAAENTGKTIEAVGKAQAFVASQPTAAAATNGNNGEAKP